MAHYLATLLGIDALRVEKIVIAYNLTNLQLINVKVRDIKKLRPYLDISGHHW